MRTTGFRSCLVLLVLGTPSPAWGLCPNCLGQSQFLTPTLKVLGIFLLVPFVVAFVVFRAIRRACRQGLADADFSTMLSAPRMKK